MWPKSRHRRVDETFDPATSVLAVRDTESRQSAVGQTTTFDTKSTIFSGELRPSAQYTFPGSYPSSTPLQKARRVQLLCHRLVVVFTAEVRSGQGVRTLDLVRKLSYRAVLLT